MTPVSEARSLTELCCMQCMTRPLPSAGLFGASPAPSHTAVPAAGGPRGEAGWTRAAGPPQELLPASRQESLRARLPSETPQGFTSSLGQEGSSPGVSLPESSLLCSRVLTRPHPSQMAADSKPRPAQTSLQHGLLCPAMPSPLQALRPRLWEGRPGPRLHVLLLSLPWCGQPTSTPSWAVTPQTRGDSPQPHTCNHLPPPQGPFCWRPCRRPPWQVPSTIGQTWASPPSSLCQATFCTFSWFGQGAPCPGGLLVPTVGKGGPWCSWAITSGPWHRHPGGRRPSRGTALPKGHTRHSMCGPRECGGRNKQVTRKWSRHTPKRPEAPVPPPQMFQPTPRD